MGLQSVLNLGKNSLAQNQTALQTIGHNIANASVEGYSRQEVVPTNNPPTQSGFGFLGTGVRVETIRQVVDRFLNGQIVQVKSDLAALTARAGAMRLAETFLNEGISEGGLNSALIRFFLSAEALSARPEGAPERTDFLNAALNLAQEFNTLANLFQDLQVQANRDISRAIGEVNEIVARIADLNVRIQTAEAGGQTANDLRDERQRSLERLSQLINIDTFEDPDGAVIVIVGKGFPIVQKGEATQIKGIENPDNVVGAAPPLLPPPRLQPTAESEPAVRSATRSA